MKVPVHGSLWGDAEHGALHEVVDSNWYTAGPWCERFAAKLRAYTGSRFALLCNSGSSANLLAVAALAQGEWGELAIRPGDEVITAAVGFPTTLNPILQVGAVPVLVDIDLPGLVPLPERIERAITERTKAVILAHTLGYPFDAAAVRKVCDKYGLWLIEDACDALGSPEVFAHAHVSTLSFHPAHHISTGQGGAVLCNDPRVAKLVTSLRDHGRDCWCATGTDNTCGKRFAGSYDHKYVYSRLGYNLAMTEFAGALGCVQMDRLDGFVERRNCNHAYLNALCSERHFEDRFFIQPPDISASWFGFALICLPGVQRNAVTRYLEERGVQTRLVFGGNLVRQPAYQAANIVVSEPLLNADIVHDCAFWIGCWSGLSREQLDYAVQCLVDYVEDL